MRIVSKFSDYYDYVEFLYSPKGGEASETYLRGELIISPDGSSASEDILNLKVSGFIPSLPRPSSKFYYSKHAKDRSNLHWSFKWVCVCGRLYLLVADERMDSNTSLHTAPDYKLITGNHPCLISYSDPATSSWKNEGLKIENVFGIYNATCVEVSRLLDCPVFLINNVWPERGWYGPNKTDYSISVSRKIPLLSKLGFAAAIPAEQMYQNIAMFLNALKGNPDTATPVQVSDKDRLIQKGFDSKISFRGKQT